MLPESSAKFVTDTEPLNDLNRLSIMCPNCNTTQNTVKYEQKYTGSCLQPVRLEQIPGCNEHILYIKIMVSNSFKKLGKPVLKIKLLVSPILPAFHNCFGLGLFLQMIESEREVFVCLLCKSVLHLILL